VGFYGEKKRSSWGTPIIGADGSPEEGVYRRGARWGEGKDHRVIKRWDVKKRKSWKLDPCQLKNTIKKSQKKCGLRKFEGRGKGDHPEDIPTKINYDVGSR